MKVPIVAGNIHLLRALLSAFRKRGHMSYGATRGDWTLHAAKLYSVVGSEFPSGSKRKPTETNAEFVAKLRERDPLMPCVCLVANESEGVPFGVAKVAGDPVCIRRVVRAVEKIGSRQGSLVL